MHYMNYNTRNKFIHFSLLVTLITILISYMVCLMIPRNSYTLKDNGYELTRSYGIKNSEVIKTTYKNKDIIGLGVRCFEGEKLKYVTFEDNINLEYIERRAFYNTKLDYIKIPKSVKYIYQNAFSYSTLEEVEFEDESNLLAISGSMFFSCTNLNKINIPENIKSIGSLAFYNCTSLKEIIIPDKVKVYANAFAGCNITIYCNDISNFEEGFDNDANIVLKSY